MNVNRIRQFETILRARGMRFTQERRLVAEFVFARTGPYRIEVLADEACNELFTQSVSRSTVYRTLKPLEQSGLICFDAPNVGEE